MRLDKSVRDFAVSMGIISFTAAILFITGVSIHGSKVKDNNIDYRELNVEESLLTVKEKDEINKSFLPNANIEQTLIVGDNNGRVYSIIVNGNTYDKYKVKDRILVKIDSRTGKAYTISEKF